MSKVMREGLVAGPLGATAPQKGEEDEMNGGNDEELPGTGPDPADLKATITLSGEALAALLEEVKAVRNASPPPATPSAVEGDRQGDGEIAGAAPTFDPASTKPTPATGSPQVPFRMPPKKQRRW